MEPGLVEANEDEGFINSDEDGEYTELADCDDEEWVSMVFEDVDTAGDSALFLLLAPGEPFLRIDDGLFLALADLALLLF